MWGKDGVGRGMGGKKGLKKGNQEIGVGSRECKVRKAVGLHSLIPASFIPTLPQSSLFYFLVKIYFPFYQSIARRAKIVPAFN